ncbi:hypothetical protein SB776_35105, partial [Burkholderia sp. SIMBA_045]
NLASLVGEARAAEIKEEMIRLRNGSPRHDAKRTVESGSVNAILPEFQLSSINAASLRAEIAVVVHLYHVDLAGEINEYLNMMFSFSS